jgi:hypothetical protein
MEGVVLRPSFASKPSYLEASLYLFSADYTTQQYFEHRFPNAEVYVTKCVSSTFHPLQLEKAISVITEGYNPFGIATFFLIMLLSTREIMHAGQ